MPSTTSHSFGSNSDERLNEGSSSEPPSESDLDPCNNEDRALLMPSTLTDGLVPSAAKRVKIDETVSADTVQREGTSKEDKKDGSSASYKAETAPFSVKQEPCDSLPLKVKLPIKKRKASLERSKGVTKGKIQKNKNESKLPKERPYKCDICNRCFEFISDLKKHAREHTEDRYKCDTCGKVLGSRGSLHNHRSVHTGEKPFSCEVCGKTFRTKVSLKVHERVHQGERPYLCKFCGKSFSQSSHMRRHERSHTGERPYQCEICGQRFTQKHAVRNHRKNVHEDKEKVRRRNHALNCRFCGLSFDKESELISHKLEHSGPKEFKCEDCEKEFQTEYTLKMHVLKMHDLPRFVCEICGKSYASRGGLHNHKKTHLDGQEKRTLKKIQCPHCPKTFPCMSVLQKHQVTHTGERPFQCQICETKLTSYGNLQRHYEQVHKKNRTKDWVCKICGESFLSQWLMKLHNKTHVEGVAPPIKNSTEEPPSGESENNTEHHTPPSSSAFGSDVTDRVGFLPAEPYFWQDRDRNLVSNSFH